MTLDIVCNATSTDYERCADGPPTPVPIPYLLESNSFTLPIYGWISPVFVLLTLITNCLVCIVLLKKPMRNCTNAILFAMAVSDTMTGLAPLPCFVYFYTMGRYRDYVPYDWCFVYFCLTEYLPTAFHTASVWLTVALAGQRYVFVCHPINSKRLCTVSNTVILILLVHLTALASQVFRFWEQNYVPIVVPSLLDPDGAQFTACSYDLTPFIARHQHVYFNVYYWFRVVFIHIIPCIGLVILNSALILTIRSARWRRESLLRSGCRPHSTGIGTDQAVARMRMSGGSTGMRQRENNSTTLMLVTVVGVFLLVEFPLAVLFVAMIVENTFGLEVFSGETSYTASLFINLFILVSYSVNFFIYCAMSHQFRQTFSTLFFRDASAEKGEEEKGGKVGELQLLRQLPIRKSIGQMAINHQGCSRLVESDANHTIF